MPQKRSNGLFDVCFPKQAMLLHSYHASSPTMTARKDLNTDLESARRVDSSSIPK